MKKICIIGVGHIGGSFAIELRKHGLASRLIGVDTIPEHRQKALEIGLVDEFLSLDKAIPASDIILLTTPVDVLVKLLPEVLDQIHPQQMVLDAGSSKQVVLASVAGHPLRSRFAATHPMAGRENSGPEAAIEGLFPNKSAVIIDQENTDADVLEWVQNMYRLLDMRIVYLDAVSHDLHVAYVSHISHISSFALALTVLAKEKDEGRIFDLASGGFDSTVRLAKSSPDMWIPIFRQNRDFVLDVLDEHINVLSQFRSLLIKRDFNTFYELIQQANHIRKILK